MSKQLLVLSGLAAGLFTAGIATGQVLPCTMPPYQLPARYSYAAKFVCGVQPNTQRFNLFLPSTI
jgi:hypothetical protein